MTQNTPLATTQNNVDADIMMLAKFKANQIKEYKKLKKKLDALYLTKTNLASIALITAKMKAIEIDCYNNELYRVFKERVSVKEVLQGATEQEKWEIIFKQNTLVVCIDIVEALSLELEELLKPYLDGGKISLYDKFKECGKQAKAIRNVLIDPATIEYQNNFAEDAEAMQLMLESVMKQRIKKRDL